MSKIEVNGMTLAYVEKGQGAPVVFIHGSASDYRIWENVQTQLAGQFRTIAYSRRFHWPNQPITEGLDYAMTDHVADLQALLVKLNAHPVHLVGHSYGALMALDLAAKNPQYIQSLILAEPPAINLYVSNSNAPSPAELLRLLLRKPRTGWAVLKLGATGLGPAANAAKKGDMQEAMRLFGTAALGKETFKRMSAARKQQVLVNLTKAEFLGSGFSKLEAKDVRNIQIPTLLLTGQKSPQVFHHLADRLADLLPRVERTEIAHASHIVQEDNPEQFTTALIAFLHKHM
ncbi:MAG: alpha/beta hydrolase [Caldilineaceae bacterium]|nr:alpha/beta hydrolase [Caldilineaceae bacterium]